MHPDDKKLAKLTRTDIKVLINRFANYDMIKLQELLQDKTRTVLEHAIGRIFLVAIKEGDYRRLDAMLDRLIGKVKEQVEVSVPKPYIVENIETNQAVLLGSKAPTIEGVVVDDEDDK